MSAPNTNAPDFSNLETACLFCDPARHGQGEQVILRSDRFYLFAGLGAILEGYIIIAPYRCDDALVPARSISELSPDLIDELMFLREIVAAFHRKEYKTGGMAFEHGRAGTCLSAGAGTRHCYHAHLCCYPSSAQLWQKFSEMPVLPVDNLARIDAATAGVPYLYSEAFVVDETLGILSPDREKIHAAVALLRDDQHLTSQYLRQLLANAVGRPKDYDWKEHPFVDRAQAVREKFHRWLRETAAFSIDFSQPCPRMEFVESTKRSNRRGNDQSAENYNKTWGRRLIHGAVGRFLAGFEDNSEARPVILDAGCGPGMYTNAFRALGLTATAIDSSPEMLRIARNTYSGDFSEGDATAPNFPPESFDGIWCSAVMVHVPRRIAPSFLQNLNTILKPGGILYLSAQLGAGCRTHPDGRTFFYYSIPELMTLITGTGFEILDTWQAATTVHTNVSKSQKVWRQFLLKKAAPPYTYTFSQSAYPGAGDAQDARDLGWFTVAATLFRESNLGNSPESLLLNVEHSASGGTAEREQFRTGVEEAARALGCPISSMQFREGNQLKAKATLLVRQHTPPPLRSRKGDSIILLGQPGLVLAALCLRKGLFSRLEEEKEDLLYKLRHPLSLHKETDSLMRSGRITALLGGRSGLAGQLIELASTQPAIDVHLDFAALLAQTPDPIRLLVESALLDLGDFLMASPDWLVLATIGQQELVGFEEGTTHFVPLGWVSEGTGRAWLHREKATTPISSFVNSRPSEATGSMPRPEFLVSQLRKRV